MRESCLDLTVCTDWYERDMLSKMKDVTIASWLLNSWLCSVHYPCVQCMMLFLLSFFLPIL